MLGQRLPGRVHQRIALVMGFGQFLQAPVFLGIGFGPQALTFLIVAGRGNTEDGYGRSHGDCHQQQ